MKMIDLSRLIYDGMPKIPILPDVHVQRFLSLEKGHPLNVTELSLPCHAGTHVDAPVHIVPNGKSIDELPLESFAGNGAVISVTKKGGEEVTVKDLESSGVEVRCGDILMLHGKPAEALVQYEQTLKHEPNRLRTLIGAAKAAQASNNSEALSKYRHEVMKQMDPTSPRIYSLKEMH